MNRVVVASSLHDNGENANPLMVFGSCISAEGLGPRITLSIKAKGYFELN